jgi:hypothetical protein
MFGKKKDGPLLKFECFEHAKKILYVSNIEHVNSTISGKYFQKRL